MLIYVYMIVSFMIVKKLYPGLISLVLFDRLANTLTPMLIIQQSMDTKPAYVHQPSLAPVPTTMDLPNDSEELVEFLKLVLFYNRLIIDIIWLMVFSLFIIIMYL